MHKSAFCLPLLLLITVPLAANLLHSDAGGPIVRLTQGKLRGAKGAGETRIFKGIPYAAPPIGLLRWKPPQPAAVWSGIRDATRPGAACIQPPSYAHISRNAMSEDCLYLNIWIPVKTADKGLPVIVWLHGGGFIVGSGAAAEDDGEELARKGVVVVTLNYRLGVFGFLAHPDLTRESPHHSSGNYGLLDQISALHWVKSNIAAFGGDPKNMTVAGQSAGATSTGFLLTSPLARGLFHQVIVESPASLFLPSPELAENFQDFLPAEAIGRAIGSSIKTMRSWPATEVMLRTAAAEKNLFPQRATISGQDGTRASLPGLERSLQPWWPFVDGWVVPRQLASTYAHEDEIAVPLLVGTNADEGSIFVPHSPYRSKRAYRGYLKRNFASCAEAMFHLYPASDPREIHKQAERIQTDALFLYGALTLASAERRRDSKVYVYRFTHVGPDPKLARLGAWHGSELAYVFGHTVSSPSRKFDTQDHAISDEMMNAWVQFATSGSPDVAGLTHWPAWGAAESYMDFGDSPSVRKIVRKRRFAIFAQTFSAKPSGRSHCHVAP